MSDLLEKWEPLLEEEKSRPVDIEVQRQLTTAQLLETQEKFLMEASNSVSGMEKFDPIMIKMVSRAAPRLIGHEIAGVQPMTGPTGLMFAMKARYAGSGGQTPGSGSATPQGGAEALFDEANTAYAGTGTHQGTNPFSGSYGTGTGKTTTDAETQAWAEMGITIEKASITATDRQLRADYSLQLMQDMQAVHGLNVENVLVDIMSQELVSEINRELVRTLYIAAKQGAQFAQTPGQYSMQNDADGRWAAERYKGLMFAIERDANAVAWETRRGKGNILIVSADVGSALAMAGILDHSPALASTYGSLNIDITGTAYAGQAGRFKVFIDPYASGNGYMVGYKGINQYDAGVFYCPYVPLQLVRAPNNQNFHPGIGFITRYAIAANPFTTLNAGQNVYYRKAEVKELM